MARTYKDKPSKLKHDDWFKDTVRVPYTRTWKSYSTGELVEHSWFYNLELPTTKPKKRKEVDTEWHWMSTPSWWTRLVMNRPQRRHGRQWEREVVKTDFESLEEVDPPGVGKKPHQYYW